MTGIMELLEADINATTERLSLLRDTRDVLQRLYADTVKTAATPATTADDRYNARKSRLSDDDLDAIRRNARHETQQQLATRYGVSRATISNVVLRKAQFA